VVKPTHLKDSQTWESSPNRVENKKYLKPPHRHFWGTTRWWLKHPTFEEDYAVKLEILPPEKRDEN